MIIKTMQGMKYLLRSHCNNKQENRLEFQNFYFVVTFFAMLQLSHDKPVVSGEGNRSAR